MSFPFRAGKEIFHAVFESLPTGICVTDAQGFFVYVNQAYCRIYGYNRDELLGSSFLKVVRPDQHALLSQLHDDFIAGKEELEAEWEVRAKGGKPISITASARRFQGNDSRYYKLTIVQETTQKKFLQRRKALADRILFQEISQPLTNIANSIASHRDEVAGWPRHLAEYCESMLEAVEVVQTRLAGMRDLGAIVAGLFQPNRQAVSVRHLYEKLGRQFFFLSRTYECRLETDSGNGPEDLVIMSDYYLLRNILENLVKNAIEASPAGGVVTLGAKVLPDRFSMVVSNSGEIPEAIRGQFFAPYVTTKPGGTGLGTYSARLLTEALGGVLKAESGSGITRISVIFPVSVLEGNTGG